jgi:Uma2 family endonuclease
MKPPTIDPKTLSAAAELGVRLEVMNGLPIWEAQPLYRHQKAVERIAQSIKPSRPGGPCACVHALDVYVQFEAGLKRPDISVFCREPSEAEQDQALTLIPEAVVEVVSKGFEAKDFELAPPFYLSQGVKDIVVFDPSTHEVLHVTATGARRMVSPVRIALACGCDVEV